MTTLRVNSPQGEPLTNPRINTYFVFKTEFYEFICICMFIFITSPSDRQICLKITYLSNPNLDTTLNLSLHIP